MADQTYPIPFFNPGMFMTWNVYTQSNHQIDVTLADSKKTYFSGSQSTLPLLPPLAEGHADIEAEALRISIDVPKASSINVSMNNHDITGSNGVTVGYVCTFCIDAYAKGDYNDLYVSLVAWHKKP